MMRPLTDRERKIAYVCAALIVVYSIYSFSRMIMYSPVDEITRQIDAKRALLTKNVQVMASGTAYAAAYGTESAARMCADTDEAINAAVMAAIDDAAKRAQVGITRVQPSGRTRQGTVARFSVDVTLDGTFENITNFLYSIQTPPIACAVVTMRIDTHARKNAAPLSAQLRIEKVCAVQ